MSAILSWTICNNWVLLVQTFQGTIAKTSSHAICRESRLLQLFPELPIRVIAGFKNSLSVLSVYKKWRASTPGMLKNDYSKVREHELKDTQVLVVDLTRRHLDDMRDEDGKKLPISEAVSILRPICSEELEVPYFLGVFCNLGNYGEKWGYFDEYLSNNASWISELHTFGY